MSLIYGENIDSFQITKPINKNYSKENSFLVCSNVNSFYFEQKKRNKNKSSNMFPKKYKIFPFEIKKLCVDEVNIKYLILL